ncbi:uncharacterized protein M421DRAFT_94238 [Didymella exigua CBS 183.55]|uniref:Uncharacterized protein n=1 Tax=Didymella exigua CBS 183.55 TaxID=1150837 RepID=A0A6A5RCZ4_9PLEO|nr:uncharacterized protein M421DRAFT_94238 [Didymella exigua CBS 183.55]KAF1926115.1 hypothetical protein M421DRAFT_94238 [Didymella exigua CBS 183.55]
MTTGSNVALVDADCALQFVDEDALEDVLRKATDVAAELSRAGGRARGGDAGVMEEATVQNLHQCLESNSAARLNGFRDDKRLQKQAPGASPLPPLPSLRRFPRSIDVDEIPAQNLRHDLLYEQARISSRRATTQGLAAARYQSQRRQGRRRLQHVAVLSVAIQSRSGCCETGDRYHEQRDTREQRSRRTADKGKERSGETGDMASTKTMLRFESTQRREGIEEQSTVPTHCGKVTQRSKSAVATVPGTAGERP